MHISHLQGQEAEKMGFGKVSSSLLTLEFNFELGNLGFQHLTVKTGEAVHPWKATDLHRGISALT